MSYIFYNPNPLNKKTTDCVIRMLCKTFNMNWEEAFLDLSKVALQECEMPSSNSVWELYLLYHNFKKDLLPNNCPYCLSVKEFTKYFPYGKYVVCTGSHVVAVEDSNYYDAWDSGDEIISYYFYEI